MNRLPASPIAGSSNTSSWSHVIGEMSGGQHRVDEVIRTEPVGWTGKKQTENCGAALSRKQRGCTTVGVCPKGIKKELNTLDEADFVRDVEKSACHHLSHFEIAEETRARLSARSPTLVCRRTDARRAFPGGWYIAQFRVANEASVGIGVVLQRNLHRMAAAFKSKLEGFVGHWIVSCLHVCSRSLQSRQ